MRVLIKKDVFNGDTIIFTDEKRWCEHDLKMFEEKPEYWWGEAHRALRDDASTISEEGKYFTIEDGERVY